MTKIADVGRALIFIAMVACGTIGISIIALIIINAMR